MSGPLGDDGTWLVDVALDGESVFTEQGTAACGEPSTDPVAAIEIDCRRSEALFTMMNAGDATRTLVLDTGGSTRRIDVAPGATVTRRVPLTEDEAYELAVSLEGGELLAFERGTMDCVGPSVLGQSVVRPLTSSTATPMSLALTGANSGLLAGAGAILVLAGCTFSRAATIRRRRLSSI